jgi:hypothetical protein
LQASNKATGKAGDKKMIKNLPLALALAAILGGGMMMMKRSDAGQTGFRNLASAERMVLQETSGMSPACSGQTWPNISAECLKHANVQQSALAVRPVRVAAL